MTSVIHSEIPLMVEITITKTVGLAESENEFNIYPKLFLTSFHKVQRKPSLDTAEHCVVLFPGFCLNRQVDLFYLP